jgi:uncharacterized protein (TIGR00251 family)
MKYAELARNRFKIKLQAPPVDGQSKRGFIAFIAETLGVPKRNVSLISGEKSRDKAVLVKGADADETGC